MMHFWSLSPTLWIFIAVGHSETNLFSSDVGLDFVDDAALGSTNNNLFFEDGNSFDSLTESDSNWLLDLDPVNEITPTLSLDTGDGILTPESDALAFLPDADLTSSLPDADLTSLISFTDPTSLLRPSIWDQINSPVADNPNKGCKVGIADDIPSFGKNKRAERPSSGSECPDYDNDPYFADGPYVRQPVPRDTVTDYFAYAFPERLDICPPEIFHTSIIPVCKEGQPSDKDSFFILGQSWMHLYDVNPRKSAHALQKCILNFIMTASQICKAILLSFPQMCPPSQEIWCCQLLQKRVCTSHV